MLTKIGMHYHLLNYSVSERLWDIAYLFSDNIYKLVLGLSIVLCIRELNSALDGSEIIY